jgi:hypothetical protein
LDDLRDEFIKAFYGTARWTYINEPAYQNCITNYVHTQTKPLVLVGLNDNTRFGKNKQLYYNVHATHRYYIDIDDMVVLRQKCIRLLQEMQTDTGAMKDLTENNDRFVKMFTQAVKRECSAKHTITLNAKWNRDYETQGYVFLSRDRIFTNVSKTLNDNLRSG